MRAIEPHAEADPAALLFQFLVGIGNIIGRGAYVMAEADRHHPNLFTVNVGDTAKARKGSSWGRVRHPLSEIDGDWSLNRIVGGPSSGEGLINEVRDPTERDPGVRDKRLLVYEAEFASVLRQILRDKNILGAVIRQAWDDGRLRSLVVQSDRATTDAHISIVGHITRSELLRQLTETDATNGLGNRFLWVCVGRSKLLPDGGGLPDLSAITGRLRLAVEFARSAGELGRDDEARQDWRAVYPEVSKWEIRRPHLRAALAAWRCCEDSARCIFGERLGDPTADTALAALRASEDGLTLEQIRSGVFARHTSGTEIRNALGELEALGVAARETVPTRGRPAEIWRAT